MEENINEGYLTFKKLIDNSSWAVTLLDAQFKVIYRSHAAERINGWSRHELSETPLINFIHPDDLPSVYALMQRVAGNPGSTEICTHRLKHVNGNYIYLKSSLTNMLEEPNVQALVYNFIDISEQKLTELEMTKQADQIAELLETMTDGFIALDENLCYTYANGQSLKMSQKTREELIGRYIWDVFPEAMGSATYQAIQTAFTEKIYVCNEDFYTPLQLWQENRVYPSGNGISLFIRDITKQKQEEHHLKLLESVITNATDAVLITEAASSDLNGPRILYVNEAFTRMTGYTAKEVIGKTPHIFQGPRTNKDELRRLGESIRRWEYCETTVINYKKNGEEFWTNFSLTPVADDKGGFTHWISIERDVTEAKNEELQKGLLTEISQLFNEPLRLELLLEKALEKVINYDHFVIAEIWLATTDKSKLNLISKVSRTAKMERYYKETSQFISFFKGESLPGTVWKTGEILEWNHLEENPNFLRRGAAKSAGIKVVYGIPMISKKTTIGVLVVGLSKLRATESIPLIPLFNTLSAHFGVEIKRKQLEEELHQIFDLAPDIICTVGTDRYLKKVNPAMSALLGYTELELLAHPLQNFLHPEDLPESHLRMGKFIAGEKAMSFENRFITKTGETLWLSWTVHLNAREGLLFCVAKDITDKKQTEQKLATSESNLNAVIENTDAYIFSLDRELRYVTFNNKLSNAMWERYQVQISPGDKVLDFTLSKYPDFVKVFEDICNKAFAGEAVQIEKEINVRETQIFYNFSIYPIWQNNIVMGLSCFITDITARKQADSLLIESEKRYIELFQLSPLPKLVFELETLRFLDVNEAAIDQYGYTREEFLQMSVEELHLPENRPFSQELLTDLRQATNGTMQHSIIMHQKKNGEKIHVEIQSNPVHYNGKNARISAARDITENLNYIAAIEAQNEKLKEISWMQSHIVRAPLARIMALVALIDITDDLPEETKKMMGYLLQSACELDKVIGDITLKTDIIDPGKI